MTHDLRDALIDALRKVCPNPEVAADACLAVVERWTADEPDGENFAPPWMLSAASSNDGNGRDLLDSTIQGVNSLIAIQEYARLDRFLDTLPAAQTSRLVLLAVARSSFPVRIKLNRWQAFVLRVRTTFLDSNLDADSLLRGLFAEDVIAS